MFSPNKYLTSLPKQPGVYQFYDKHGTILYVGKAKNLKSRVSSYFLESNKGFKNRVLTKQIENIEHIIVETEEDALLLENNLIKQYQPKYNVLLKDDKTFPWVCIKNEPFPRVFLTRNRIKDGSKYFGPYTSVVVVRTLLNFIKDVYPIRTCKHALTENNIQQGRFKRCLEYHLGNCLAPCEQLQTESEYLYNIENIKDILKGNITEVIALLETRMLDASKKLQFEEAEKLKQKLGLLERYKAKSTIVSTSIHNIDVFGYDIYERSIYINYLRIVNGSIVQSYSTELLTKLEEELSDVLAYAIVDIRRKVESTSPSALVPFNIDYNFGFSLIVPQKGDKKKLLDLAIRNAANLKRQKLYDKKEYVKKRENKNIVNQLKADLRLQDIPIHIECFDNSNIQGTHPVAACVVFKNGKPSKKDYRHYHIKTVEGANDFASMEEVVYRRYKRLIDEKTGLPQLVIIDGGKGQLSSAVKSLKELNIYQKVAIIGIAKRLEEIYFPDDSVPLYLDKNSASLKLIQNLRNEAHRFGITFHRKLRENSALDTELLQIEGIGEKTAQKLLMAFGSTEILKKMQVNEIATVAGLNLAQKIHKFFNND